jgi:hypothetical protein
MSILTKGRYLESRSSVLGSINVCGPRTFGPHSNYHVTVLLNAWEQCQDADVLLESPSAMAGVHIAEALSQSSVLGRRHG